MRYTRQLIAGGLIALALSAGSGCGSKDSSSDDSASKADVTTTTGASASTSGDCAGTAATITDLKTGEATKLDHSGGVSFAGGAAYTVYVADTEIDPDSISMVNTPKPDPGHHVVTVAMTVFNAKDEPAPITAGTKITFTPDFGVLTFRVIDDTVERSANSAADAKGDITVTAVGDSVCFTIDYTDDEKTLTGTVEAPIKQL